MSKQITKAEFDRLTPFERGYVVYMAGERDDQPNVPNESNPYRGGSWEHNDWKRGYARAVQAVMDLEE